MAAVLSCELLSNQPSQEQASSGWVPPLGARERCTQPPPTAAQCTYAPHSPKCYYCCARINGSKLPGCRLPPSPFACRGISGRPLCCC